MISTHAMGAPISIALRDAVVRADEQGLSYEETAKLLGIGYATVNRILRLHRETGSVEPRPRGGGNVSPITGVEDVARLLRALVAAMPDATAAELAEALMRGATIQTSTSSVQRALHRLGFTRKKRASSRPSATRPSTRLNARPT